MIQPKRAPVRPRVICPASGEALPLEDEIRRLLDAGARGVVAILGEPSAGKTTALQHLAAVLPPKASVLLLDECDLGEQPDTHADCLCIRAAQWAQAESVQASYWLAPWGDDDAIEYLLSVHKDCCASVMARLRREDDALCGGSPELWRVVLDRLAGDGIIPNWRSAMRREVAQRLVTPELLRQASWLCIGDLVVPRGDDRTSLAQFFAAEVRHLLRHRSVQLLLAADIIAENLRGAGDASALAHRLPRELVNEVAAAIAGDMPCLDKLHEQFSGTHRNHAMAASILHAAGISWRPEVDCTPVLRGAYLNGVAWSGVVLAHADLDGADFTAADLSDADLRSARAHEIAMTNAHLNRAVLERIEAIRANFAGADLSDAQASDACFEIASLRGANLTDAVLDRASFVGADLTAAVFRGAELDHADLTDAVIEGADFSDAFLEGARLSGLRLREATWTDASFGAAQMAGCDLEGLELPGVCFEDANLHGALLTGCVMPGANFDYACLKSAGLGDVDWEGASLREADLRGATFHMGSSRSGLVGSPIASEGSRTGFYTDDYEEQYYKAPEEIRKANLCHADLRGAQIDGVDFYLVDLRGARYDAEHEDHFRRCGAILKARLEE
jgi:uncharacterized protein YjbI with pentapeptide repeats